jgi:hypothetical protein
VPLQIATHRFNQPSGGQGIYPDAAAYGVPEGGMVRLDDMLADKPGLYRKRGGTHTLLGGNEAAYAQTLVGLSHPDASATLAGFGRSASGGTTGTMYYVNPATAAHASVGAFTAVQHATHAFTHLNHALVGFYPQDETGQSGLMKTGGASGAKSNIASLSVTIVASTGIVGVSGASTANMEVGMYLTATDDGTASKKYVGRITRLFSTDIEVEPVPTISIGASGTNATITNSLGNVVTGQVYGGKTAVSWQNRIVLGNLGLVTSVSGVTHFPERVAFTILPTEAVPSFANYTGLVQFYGPALSSANWFDVVGVEQITGLARMGEGELVVFGPERAFRVTGTLETQDANSDDPSWAVGEIPSSVGCVNADTIQYAPQGVIFASRDDVYLYDGSAMQPLMAGRTAREYANLIVAGTTPIGSGIIRGHYFVAMSNATAYLIDLGQNGAPVTKLTNFAYADAVRHPDAATTTVFGLRWWNQGGAAPTMTGGQVTQVDGVFVPSTGNLTDADGTSVTPSWQTPALTEGDESMQKRFNMVKVDHSSPIAIGGTLEAARSLNPSSWGTIGTVTTANPASFGDYVKQTPAISYRMVQLVTSDTYELEAVSHAFQPCSGLRSLVA